MTGSPKESEIQSLIESGSLRVYWSPRILLSTLPAQVLSEDCIRGMLLGLAIGDSLGNMTEGQLPSDRRERYGELHDYLPNRYSCGRRVGLPSDDTQLTFWTLELLFDQGRIEPSGLARLFASRQIYGIGRTTRYWLLALDYNTNRPHTSLNGLTPTEFAARPNRGQTQNGFYL